MVYHGCPKALGHYQWLNPNVHPQTLKAQGCPAVKSSFCKAALLQQVYMYMAASTVCTANDLQLCFDMI